MGKQATNKTWDVTGKLDKLVLELARGRSKRDIAEILNIDRNQISKRFGSKVKTSIQYCEQISQDVLKNKLTYDQVLSKYGKRGLTALNNLYTLRVADSQEKFKNSIIAARGNLSNPKASLNKIARDFNVSHTCVWDKMQRASRGKKNPNIAVVRGKKVSDIVCTLFKGGMEVQKIAGIVGLSATHIRNIVRERGLRTSEGPVFTKDDFNKIAKLRHHGVSWSLIGAIFNVRPRRVSSFYNDYKYIYSTGGGKNEETKSQKSK